MGANESTTKRCSVTLNKCDINRRERFFLPYSSFFEVVYPPPRFHDDGTIISDEEKVGGEYKIKNISKNIKLVHVQCTALICPSTFVTPDMTFSLTDECARDHSTQVTVQIDVSQEIVLPYFLHLDKKVLQNLKEGEGDKQIITLPGYSFLTFKCLITKIGGYFELFIENLKFDVKINGHSQSYFAKLIVGDDGDNYFIYKLDFSFNPDYVKQQNSEAQKASDLASKFPATIPVESGANANSFGWVNLDSSGTVRNEQTDAEKKDEILSIFNRRPSVGEEAKPTGIFETVVADSKADEKMTEAGAEKVLLAAAAGGSSSTTSTPNGTKSFQDSIKAFSNGLKELLSLPPVYVPPPADTSSVPILNPTTVASTQLQPPPPTASPQIPKKLIATLIQKEQYFNKILSETKYTDAILINQNGEEVRGFRCFLAHISPVFQAIFDTKEDQLPVRIEVGAFKVETLKQITQFSQGAEFEVNENVMELLKFAKKFSINLLIDRCYSWIATNITDKNICEYIKFAYVEEHTVLKKRCLEYLKTNKLSIDPDSIKALPQEILFDAFFS